MSNVLKGSGNDGDFVLNGQEIANKQGFNHVSKIWYDQTMSYDEGFETLQKIEDQRKDIKAKPSEMVPYWNEETGEVGFEYSDGSRYVPDGHALCQYGTNAGAISHAFLKDMQSEGITRGNKIWYERDEKDAYALYTVMKNGHRRMRQDKEYLWRCRKDGTMKAVLTDSYVIVNNMWYLKVLQKLIPSGRLSHFSDHTIGDTLYGNVLIPESIRDGYDGEYGGMISIGNCEIGKRRMSQMPSLFRAICMNGCIWDQTVGTKYRKVHRGNWDAESEIENIRLNIHDQIPLVTTKLDVVLAQMDELRKLNLKHGATMPQIVAHTVKGSNLGKRFAGEVLTQFVSNQCEQSAFGFVDALTRAGQKFEGSTWVKSDELGGKFLTGAEGYWERVCKGASTIKDEQLAKLIAV